MTQASTPPAARPINSPPSPTSGARQANIPLILISVGLGLITVLATNWYVQKIKTQVSEDTMILYQLNRSVEPGDKLRERDVNPTRVPNSLKETYIDKLHCIPQEHLPNKIGQTFENYGSDGEFLTFDLFTPRGDAQATAVQPAEGKRSLTIPVNAEWTSKTLAPEDYVDISAVLNIPGRRTQDVLIMERVRVLGVGNRFAGSPDGTSRGRSSNSITIEVSPDEKSALVTIGRYAVDEQFVLVERNKKDREEKIESSTVNPEVLKMLGISVESN